MNKIIPTLIISLIVVFGVYYFSAQSNGREAPETRTSQDVDTGLPEEHADQKVDLTIVVTNSIVGKWQSIDDKKSVREFKSDATMYEVYDGKEIASGTWMAFTKERPVTTSFPLEANTPYFQILSGNDALQFKIIQLTPETLELIYMNRGGTLRYSRIQ